MRLHFSLGASTGERVSVEGAGRATVEGMERVALIALFSAGLAVLPARRALADGVSLKKVPLHQITPPSAYAVAVDRIQRVAGKPAISAVVREVLGSGSHPVPSDTFQIGQRVELPTYRDPKAVAGKWVVARRYWNVCPDNRPGGRLLVSGPGYFETLCDTRADRIKLRLFLGVRPDGRFRKRPTATLRRGLGDPDTYFWATLELKQRRKLRDGDIIAAARRMPDGCGVSPLFDHGGRLEGGARRRFAAAVVAQLARSKRERFARFVAHMLGDASQRPLLVTALAQLHRVRLVDASAARRVCAVIGAIGSQLKKRPSDKERAAARRLLAKLARHKAFDEHCPSDAKRLAEAVAAP